MMRLSVRIGKGFYQSASSRWEAAKRASSSTYDLQGIIHQGRQFTSTDRHYVWVLGQSTNQVEPGLQLGPVAHAKLYCSQAQQTYTRAPPLI